MLLFCEVNPSPSVKTHTDGKKYTVLAMTACDFQWYVGKKLIQVCVDKMWFRAVCYCIQFQKL